MINDNQIKSITIGIVQKINLGNYETRDIPISWVVDLLDGQNPEDATIEIRNRILNVQKEYYVSTKDAIAGVDSESKKIIEEIERAENIEIVNEIKPKVANIKDEKAKNRAINVLNDKILSLSKE